MKKRRLTFIILDYMIRVSLYTFVYFNHYLYTFKVKTIRYRWKMILRSAILRLIHQHRDAPDVIFPTHAYILIRFCSSVNKENKDGTIKIINKSPSNFFTRDTCRWDHTFAIRFKVLSSFVFTIRCHPFFSFRSTSSLTTTELQSNNIK